MNYRKIVLTLTFTILFAYSFQQMITVETVPENRTCGSYRPTTSQECSSLNTNSMFCCFMTNPKGVSFCLRFNSTEWDGSDTWEFNKTTYSMKCDVVDYTPATNFTNNAPNNLPTNNEAFSNNNTPMGGRSNDTCGSANPTSSSDCTVENSFYSYCCLLSPIDGSNPVCKKISPLSYQPSMNVITIGTTIYDINCDIKDGSPGTLCGVTNPYSPTDCTSYSTDTNSCCYNSQSSNPGCYWFGSKADPAINTSILICS